MSQLELDPGWRRALEVFLRDSHSPGSFLSDAWLDEHLGTPRAGYGSYQEFERANLRRLSAFKRFEEELLEQHQLALKRDGEQRGYLVLTASQQLEHAKTEGIRRLRAAYRWSANQLVHTNTEALTDRERAEHAEAIAKLARMRGMTNRELRSLHGTQRKLPPPDEDAK